MKILCTADYHIDNWFDFFQLQENVRNIRSKYEIVVAAGDLFEAEFFIKNNPYRLLELLFPGKKVIATLGNHEFIQQNPKEVLKHLKGHCSEFVCYLDFSGKMVVGDFNFIGNVLWYDDSMAMYSFRTNYDFSIKKESDYKFNPRLKFDECCAQVYENYDCQKKNILVTHMCPHRNMNRFIRSGEASNAYSGSRDYLEKLNFEIAICGHTHAPVDSFFGGKRIVNVGSYKDRFLWKIIDAS